MAKKTQFSKKEKKLHLLDITLAISFFAINALGAMNIVDDRITEAISSVLVAAFGAITGWRTRNNGISSFIWWTVSVIALFYLINIIIKSIG